jgi:hypothetical protein
MTSWLPSISNSLNLQDATTFPDENSPVASPCRGRDGWRTNALFSTTADLDDETLEEVT